jgi:GTP-binding protein HflX
VDASRDPTRQIDAVNQVLVDIGVAPKPVVLALNKSDLLDAERVDQLRRRFPDGVLISAETGAGVDKLVEKIASELSSGRVEVRLSVPFERGDVVARLHEESDVVSESYDESGTLVIARMPKELISDFSEYLAPTEA